MNISVEDLFPESFKRIKEEEANRPDPDWFAHLPPEKKLMRICLNTCSNPLMIFLRIKVGCSTLHYRKWNFICHQWLRLLIIINFLR